MNNQFVVCKEETITLDFPWCLDNFLLFFRRELRQIINKLPRVLRIWNDESKLELIGSNDFSAEIMPLYHLHLVHWLGSNAEVEGKTHSRKL